MSTTTKKDLIDRIADQTKQKRIAVKRTVQCFLENVIAELSEGRRIEFRDFGVFEIRERSARVAQNPRTLEPVPIPARKTVKFKIGRLMKDALEGRLTTEALAASFLALDGEDDGDDDGEGEELDTRHNGSQKINK